MSFRRSIRTCVSPRGNPHVCTAFEEYGDVPETVPLDFTEDDVTWVASKLSGAGGALGVEAIKLRNWLLRFGCASEELRVVVASLAGWMANSSLPWAAYCALMACRLVALDKRSRVRSVGIGETLQRALAKLVMRSAGEQAMTECGNLCSKKLHLQSYLEMLWSEMGYFGLLGNNLILFIILLYNI